ncbi:hydroxyacid dehydrogenase [Lujinxingia litoralis]|uniref:Hydroxyacid dehydrogenase n=1 Tax=Lujinxingia litoralis TaxID=2211119 RepID=A0A328C085_9DELT|nr:2-hydroxyacid dehydrogenase [Lujinxingia litoralis]RAL19988.1 hydroxyacid dehydrogenase [Lujinxingia litoralis]
MNITIFSAKHYDRTFFDRTNTNDRHTLRYLEPRLNAETASLAEGADAVCAFVNDQLDEDTLRELAARGVKLILLRSAGFNHVDLAAATRQGLTVARVPAYSPHAVAEHTLALILTLNRQTHRAFNRVREHNFSLEGLIGFDLHQKTVGIIGTGTIGTAFASLLSGFGCRLLAYDPYPNDACKELGVDYVDLPTLLGASHIISLHCPLTPETHHLINAEALEQMRPGVMLINTSRGAIVDTRAVIQGLKNETIGYLGLDVYEEEEALFFEDQSEQIIHDDLFARLLTFPNVLITGHQGFFTREALSNIARITLANATAFESGQGTLHEVTLKRQSPA